MGVGSLRPITGKYRTKFRLATRLDHFYGPLIEIAFFGKLCPVDVLMDVTGSNHLLILTLISLRHSVDAPPSSVIKLNVSHLESEDF